MSDAMAILGMWQLSDFGFGVSASSLGQGKLK